MPRPLPYTRRFGFLCFFFILIVDRCHAYFSQPSLVIVFGRPGSGKTTIAERALAILQSEHKNDLHCIGLDLDVCIPTWMKDNFSKGIYPTLQQRIEFAKDCCGFVESKCMEEQSKVSSATNQAKTLAALISFSFVNDDLREVFRTTFPNAVWVLVDTSEEVANIRISEREGHFYVGKLEDGDDESVSNEESTTDTATATSKHEDEDVDNSEWNFAPVGFPHQLLDGNDSIEANAKKVSDIVRETSSTQSKL